MRTVKMRGIDVSYWQGRPAGYQFRNFKSAGWDFIIARIGYSSDGTKSPDSTFEYNFSRSKRYGLRFGAYFYSNAKNAIDGRAEAQYVLQLLDGRRLDMPIWIDMEDNATSGKATRYQLATACMAFCNTLEAEGYMAGVYASASWFQYKIGELGDLRKWVAQYNDRVTYSGKYDMWQYSSTAIVPGFSGRRDADKSYVLFDGSMETKREPYKEKYPKLPCRGYFQYGDRGRQVKYLQKLLNWATNFKLAIDGIFGERTLNAVRDFQEMTGLVEDGLFGKKSLAKIKTLKR